MLSSRAALHHKIELRNVYFVLVRYRAVAEKQCSDVVRKISRSCDTLTIHLSLFLSPCSTRGVEVRNNFLGCVGCLSAKLEPQGPCLLLIVSQMSWCFTCDCGAFLGALVKVVVWDGWRLPLLSIDAGRNVLSNGWQSSVNHSGEVKQCWLQKIQYTGDVQGHLHLGAVPSAAVIAVKVTQPLLGSCKAFLEAASRASYSFGMW